jgi:hypothetical protein
MDVAECGLRLTSWNFPIRHIHSDYFWRAGTETLDWPSRQKPYGGEK